MKTPMKQSRQIRSNTGTILADPMTGKRFKPNALALTQSQRENVKRMGIKPDKNLIEREAVKILKQTVTFNSAYNDPDYFSDHIRRKKTSNSKSITKRQHRKNSLIYASVQGSNRADKMLASSNF